MGSRDRFLTLKIVDICKRLDSKGFVANHDGNVTVKFDEYLLATPTAESKAVINEDMIITLDMEGKKVSGIGKPFSEIKYHLEVYNVRKDANAVVHAHPPFTMAYGLTGQSFNVNVPEAVVSIGASIPTTKFVMPGDISVVHEALSLNDMFMIPGNGVFAIGDDLEQAYLRIELLEHLLKITHYSTRMGKTMDLSPENVASLMEKRRSIGLGPEARQDAQAPNQIRSESPSTDGALKDIIAEEIKKILQGS